MLLELYEFALVFTFGTSFVCFLISSLTGIILYFGLVSLIVDNRRNEADIGFLTSLSILSWGAFIGILISMIIGFIVRINCDEKSQFKYKKK